MANTSPGGISICEKDYTSEFSGDEDPIGCREAGSASVVLAGYDSKEPAR